jgi:hypothetical protein
MVGMLCTGSSRRGRYRVGVDLAKRLLLGLAADTQEHCQERKTDQRQEYSPPFPRRRKVRFTSTNAEPGGGMIKAGSRLSHADEGSPCSNVRKWAKAERPLRECWSR